MVRTTAMVDARARALYTFAGTEGTLEIRVVRGVEDGAGGRYGLPLIAVLTYRLAVRRGERDRVAGDFHLGREGVGTAQQPPHVTGAAEPVSACRRCQKGQRHDGTHAITSCFFNLRN